MTLLYFWRKNEVFRKSHWEKLCRQERLSLKDTARKHNLLNILPALGNIHRQSSSAEPTSSPPQTSVPCLCFHFCPEGVDLAPPVSGLRLSQNHRALFTTTKTRYLGFKIQLAAVWVGYFSFLFILSLFFLFWQYSKLYLDATSGDGLLHSFKCVNGVLEKD